MATSLFTRTSQAQTRKLSNAILRRTVLSIIAFVAVYLTVIFAFMMMVGNIPMYRVWASFLFAPFVALAICGFFGGLVLLVREGINRALANFDLLLDSVSDILSKREGPVVLPDELAPTAAALNSIKATSDQNERTAKAAEERKNELVVYLAHDIKTPLTSIVGYLALLDESPDLPVEVRARYTNITLAKAYRLEELLEEFFEITRYNLQALPIERSRFDAALFVNQVLDEFYPLAEGRTLQLVYDGPESLSVFADASRVARVLNNVMKNAVAYADTGTEVSVHTGLSVATDGFVWWELSVSNRGRELSPQHLERIFEKFFRSDEARGSSGGAGLGLAIAREIARAHGGDIYATSDAGLTSFTIWIPQGPSV